VRESFSLFDKNSMTQKNEDVKRFLILFSKVQKERIRILGFLVAETDILYFRKNP
jgi:hypothetical protein